MEFSEGMSEERGPIREDRPLDDWFQGVPWRACLTRAVFGVRAVWGILAIWTSESFVDQ